MNKKGVGWEGYLIGLIIMVAVVIISIYGIIPWFSNLFAFFRKGYEDLPASDKSKIDANFNQLIENIKACAEIDDSECLCDGFGKFPNTFPSNCKLSIEQKLSNAYVYLLFNEKKALEAEIEQAKITAMGYFSYGWDEIPEVKDVKKKILNFDLEEIENEFYPYFHTKILGPIKGKALVVTNKLYKSTDKIGFISSRVTTKEGVAWNKLAVEKLPICLPKRLDAIKEFDKIVNALKKGEERNLTIKLPQNYRIWIYNKRSIALQYKIEEKGELVEKYGETTVEKAVYELFTFDIKCKEPAKEEFLLDGDKIKIKKTKEAACIEKV